MDPKEIEGLFRGPAIRTLFGRMIQPPGNSSPNDNMNRIKAAELIGSIVAKQYIVIERRFDESGVFLKVKLDLENNEWMFEKVRTELKQYRLYPRMVVERGEHYILVFPLPKRGKGRSKVNLILLIATIFTTVWAGSLLWMMRGEEMNSIGDLFLVLIDIPAVLMGGLTFALPLLLILGTHELGHFFTARRYNIDASLPYFIPIPPFISPIGTFGALISMKEPITNRKSLIDIGAAGPIAGFIVAIPVTIVGLLLTKAYPVAATLMEGEMVMIINPPLLFHGFMWMLGIPEEGVLYPTAFAGWLGLFVTALNLLPVGQLDGGHIIRGTLGNRSKYVSNGALIIMVILGIFTGFSTYIFFAILILILGARHPPPLDDISPLTPRQWFVAGLSLFIMILTFHPVPLEQMTIKGEGVEMINEWGEHFVSPDVPNYEQIMIENSGSSDKEITIQVFFDGILVNGSIANKTPDVDPLGWGEIPQKAFFTYKMDGWYILLMGSRRFELPGRSTHSVPLVLGCSNEKEFGTTKNISIIFHNDDGKETITHFKLVRASVFLELEMGDYHGSLVVNGTLWNLEGIEGASFLSLSRNNATGDAVFIFHPVTGPWSSMSSDQVESFTDNRAQMRSIHWSAPEGVVSNCTFTLELDKHTGEPSGEELLVHYEGPGIFNGQRNIILP